jgi:uncharacterized DUF497 family protein
MRPRHRHPVPEPRAGDPAARGAIAASPEGRVEYPPLSVSSECLLFLGAPSVLAASAGWRALDTYIRCTYNVTVSLEWDPAKADSNYTKHGVDFADAALALEDERALTIPDDANVAEDRFITLGIDPLGRVLVVVYAWRGDRIRLISARKATRREREHYEERR